MDSKRAQQIMESHGVIEVLYQGEPVWIEEIRENNIAEVTYMETNRKDEVPVYLLVENQPGKK